MQLKRTSIVFLAALAVLGACAGRAPNGSFERRSPGVSDSATVRATLDRFITDFNNLDSARFSALWAPEASAILPFPDTPHRLDGRAAVLERFMRYFAQMRAERSGPPFLHMVLRNVRIDLPADGVAVVAYEFDAAGSVRNRALVMTRDATGQWRILQMHGA